MTVQVALSGIAAEPQAKLQQHTPISKQQSAGITRNLQTFITEKHFSFSAKLFFTATSGDRQRHTHIHSSLFSVGGRLVPVYVHTKNTQTRNEEETKRISHFADLQPFF